MTQLPPAGSTSPSRPKASSRDIATARCRGDRPWTQWATTYPMFRALADRMRRQRAAQRDGRCATSPARGVATPLSGCARHGPLDQELGVDRAGRRRSRGGMRSVDGWLIRRRMRARWPSTFAVAAIVALTSLIAFLAIGTARRTGDAFRASSVAAGSAIWSSTRRWSRPASTVPSGTCRASTPSRPTASSSARAPSCPSPATRRGWELPADPPLTNRRFGAMDRPAISAGRLPTGRSEAFISVPVAKAGDLRPR